MDISDKACDKMLHIINKVEYLEGYKLKLHFNNKEVKVVDLGNMIKKAKNMIVPLKDMDYFKKVKCDGTTICWPNGVDLCPDVLYAMSCDSEPVTKKCSKKPFSVPKIRRKQKLKTH